MKQYRYKKISKKRLAIFFEEIEAVCKKHNASISHEDGHGSFLIEKYHDYNMDWLKSAFVEYV